VDAVRIPMSDRAVVVAIKQPVITAVVRQFGHPRGIGGRLAGWVMAYRSSNKQRNRWVVSLLDVQPTDHVLEIGFGPGLAIAELSRRATRGMVYGIDHSDTMLKQATKRNTAAIRAQRVKLVQASSEQLPTFDEPLDAVFAVNSLGFWPEPTQRLIEVRTLLRPGGRIAIATQPRCPGATAQTSTQAARDTAHRLREAGFTQTRVETLHLKPPVVCVLAPPLVSRGPRTAQR
jgi:ubiquinone/menaquinone biosynthesis C-methylase UbiE